MGNGMILWWELSYIEIEICKIFMIFYVIGNEIIKNII